MSSTLVSTPFLPLEVITVLTGMVITWLLFFLLVAPMNAGLVFDQIVVSNLGIFH